MAFRLTHDRPMDDQMERIVRKELRSALENLSARAPDQDAIHEARKSVKKVRAVLRVVRQASGRRYDDENQRLRKAARALSALRDADATVETVRTLHRQFPTVLTPPIMRRVLRGLRGRTRRTKQKIQPLVARARGTLKRSAKSAAKEVRRVASFKHVCAGTVEGFRNARRILRDLTAESGSAAFHEWRKRVKDHWYDIRLFEGLHRGPRSRVNTLDRLETWLGDDHDLAMLQTVLLDGGAAYGDAKTKALILGCIARSQASLRSRALRLGHRTFAESPRDFAKSVDNWWKSR
jgi:CHAD domain-containing protein